MMWLLIIIALLIIILIYLLFAPIYLEINNRKGLFQLRIHKLVNAKLINCSNSIIIELKIGFWKKQIDLLKLKTKSGGIAEVKPTINKGTVPLKKILALLKSFKLRTFYVNVDFGNEQLNGILYPLFFYHGYINNRFIRINFLNKNEVVLIVENRLYNMIWSFLK